jgi:hypothetical protein
MDDVIRALYQDGDELNQAVEAWMPKHTRRATAYAVIKRVFPLINIRRQSVLNPVHCHCCYYSCRL